MVVQDTCEEVEDNNDDTTNESDGDHKNGTENRNGTLMERLENSSHNGEEHSDEEPETVDLSR